MTLDAFLEKRLLLKESRITLGLDRIQTFVEKVPLKKKCPIIAIGGTNGKGSCLTTLVNIYTEAGYNVCSFISPHIESVNERFKMNHDDISSEELLSYFKQVEQMSQDLDLSYFEFLCAVAWLMFCDKTPDVMIFEIGMGGRLDAVNALPISLSVITSIDLDHEAYLGNTRDVIAKEKFAIARQNTPLVIGDPNLTSLMLNHLETLNAKVYRFNQSFSAFNDGGNIIYQGEHQIQFKDNHVNVHALSCALKVIEILNQSLPVTANMIPNILSQLVIPGRFEYLIHEPPLIVDVAHNTAAMTSLMKRWPYARDETVMIVAFKQGKRITSSIKALGKYAKRVYFLDLEDDAFIDQDVFIANISREVHYEIIKPSQLRQVIGLNAPKLAFGCFKIVELVKKLMREGIDVN
ncbi:MAG: hypothetical protein CMF42_04680 [Legionellales bacterium]|nr:hypothetical protein [Legionellales bacterium]OUX67314.1 MAG: hypothetical protein CBD38_02870 [bacterium TMED178]